MGKVEIQLQNLKKFLIVHVEANSFAFVEV